MPRYKAIEEGQGLFLDLHLEEQFDEYSLEKTVNSHSCKSLIFREGKLPKVLSVSQKS